MTCGIYCYKDTQNNDKIVYVGKDSNIGDNKRHKDHHRPSNYKKQVINRVLQNNPNRYTYHILKQGEFNDNLLNALEIIYTHRYNPKFSFTIGGDGSRGYKHSEESKQRMSEARKGKNHPMYNKYGEEHCRYGKKDSLETRLNKSKVRNTTGYYRVTKMKTNSCNQGFRWGYSYYEDGKRRLISSVDIEKLESKVKSKGLPWILIKDVE